MVDKEVVESLNKISSNLVDINNTLKETNTEKIEKPINYDEMVETLIQKIDSEKSLFSKRDYFHGWGSTILIIIAYLLIVGEVFVLSLGSTIQNITFAIAVGALLLSFVSSKSKYTKNNIVEANLEKAVTKFEIEMQDDKKKIILESLINIKAKNPSYKLETAKEIHPEMY